MMKPHLAAAVVLIGMSAANAQAAGTQAPSSSNTALHAIDTNKDGTISLEEARKAAEAKFAALDTDHDGTVDAKELLGTMRPATMKRADKDNDGTLDREEYLSVVETRFKAADTDHDGTLSLSELKMPRGQSLLKLLQY